jgi:hypothetical protein
MVAQMRIPLHSQSYQTWVASSTIGGFLNCWGNRHRQEETKTWDRGEMIGLASSNLETRLLLGRNRRERPTDDCAGSIQPVEEPRSTGQL